MMFSVLNTLRSFGENSSWIKISLLVGVGILIIKALIIPAAKSYGRSKNLDNLFGTIDKHWFYGDTKFATHKNRLFHILNQTKIFPKMFNRWLGPLLSEVVVYHPDTVLSVLASGAPKYEIARSFFEPWIGDGLLMSSGKKWQRNRSLLTPAFHYNILRPYTRIFNHNVSVMLKKWKRKLGNPVEVSRDVSLMTLDTILQCAMSSKTDCQNIKGAHPYIKAIYDLTATLTKRFVSPFYLIDWIFYNSPDGRKFKNAAKIVHEHAEKIIQQRKKAINEMKKTNKSAASQHFAEKNNKPLDFLDILLETKDEDGVGLSDREIRDEVDTFLFEGHDTTASGISWALYNLAKHTEFQEKCRREVIEAIGDKTEVECEDLSKLNYLTMFIKESLRIHPPVPVIGREHEKPMKFSHISPEKVLPSKSLTTVHIFSVHRHEDVWENPLAFDPERFTKENIAKRSPHAYIPFSAGSSNGGKFRNAEIKSIKRRSLCKELDCFSSSMQNELCKDIECPDVDECSDGSHKCHTNAKCFNAEGSYICRCNLGYEGDGFTCKLLA